MYRHEYVQTHEHRQPHQVLPSLEVDIDTHATTIRHRAPALPETLCALFISIKVISPRKHKKVKFITCQTFLVENANR